MRASMEEERVAGFALANPAIQTVGVVIGGVGSIPGTWFAGLLVPFVPNVAEQVSKGLEQAM